MKRNQENVYSFQPVLFIHTKEVTACTYPVQHVV